MRLIFPSDPCDPTVPDESFRDEIQAFTDLGFSYSLFSQEAFSSGSVFFRRPSQEPDRYVYRGWMLNEEEYKVLEKKVDDYKGKLVTNRAWYLGCHHFPGWYALIHELTAESRWLVEDSDPETAANFLRNLGWDKVFVKDFVKSLTTSVGPIIVSQGDYITPSQVRGLLDEMRKYRGTIEGGIVFRRVEHYIKDTEMRYFAFRDKVYAPEASGSLEGIIPPIVSDAARRIRAPFFSIDMAYREDGESRIIEVGDGQVSGLKNNWTVQRFAEILKKELV